MAKDSWPPAETRYFFQLYAEEKKKGNKPGLSMNKEGKKNIMDAFAQRFNKRFPSYQPFKNKYDTSRKKYMKIRMLAKNWSGLGYDSMGRIDMSDHWWSEREKEFPGIRKATHSEIDNMDMFAAEFGGGAVTGAEGFSAASLASGVGEDEGDDEADSQPAAETQALETETQPQVQRQTQPTNQPQAQHQSQPATQTNSGSSRA